MVVTFKLTYEIYGNSIFRKPRWKWWKIVQTQIKLNFGWRIFDVFPWLVKNEHLLYVGMEKNTSIFLQLYSLKLRVGAFPKRELVFLLKGLNKSNSAHEDQQKYIATHTCHIYIYIYIYIHIVYTNIHIIYGIYTATFSCATISSIIFGVETSCPHERLPAARRLHTLRFGLFWGNKSDG